MEEEFRLELGDSSFISYALTNLYDDPMMAAVRETYSNACEAGEEVSIDLNGSEITITDNGPGMSREELEEHFLSFGNSTNGRMGLGSMAPLAAADMFELETSDGIHVTNAKVYSTDKGIYAKIGQDISSKRSYTRVSFELKDKGSYFLDQVKEICRREGTVINGEKVSTQFPISDDKVSVWSPAFPAMKAFDVLTSYEMGRRKLNVTVMVDGVAYTRSIDWTAEIIYHADPEEVELSRSKEEILNFDELADKAFERVSSIEFLSEEFDPRLSEMISSYIRDGNQKFFIDGQPAGSTDVMKKYLEGEDLGKLIVCRSAKKGVPGFVTTADPEIASHYSEEIDVVNSLDSTFFVYGDGTKEIKTPFIPPNRKKWYTCNEKIYRFLKGKKCPIFYLSRDKIGLSAKKVESDIEGFRKFCLENRHPKGTSIRLGRTVPRTDDSFHAASILLKHGDIRELREEYLFLKGSDPEDVYTEHGEVQFDDLFTLDDDHEKDVLADLVSLKKAGLNPEIEPDSFKHDSTRAVSSALKDGFTEISFKGRGSGLDILDLPEKTDDRGCREFIEKIMDRR